MNAAPVLDHSLDLPPHGQEHQNQPVKHQHRPEDRQVENLAPATHEGQRDRSCSRMPEFELGEASDERFEFLVVLRRQGRGFAGGDSIFHVLILLERGVELGANEGEEEVEEVDA